MGSHRAVGRKQRSDAVGVQHLDKVGAAGQAQHFANQAAARMADHMDFGFVRQAPGQRQRVVDRALRQCPVLQREGPIAVDRRQLLA